MIAKSQPDSVASMAFDGLVSPGGPFFDQLPGRYLILTPCREIVAATDAFLRAVSTTREALVGRNLLDVLPRMSSLPPRAWDASIARAIESRRPDTIPLAENGANMPEDGPRERFSSAVHTPMVGADGEVSYVVLQLEEQAHGHLATELEAVRASADELRRQVETFEQCERLKDTFMGMVSHEIRTPLHAILGYAEMLEEALEPQASPDVLTNLGCLIANGGLLLTLISDLLDASRVKAGKFSIEPCWVELEPLLQSVKRTIIPLSELRNIRLERRIAPDLPEVYLDGRRFVQVLINLLSNAVKFTPRGGVVVCSASIEQDEFYFEVRDQGPGIAPEDMGSLFQPFCMLHAEKRQVMQGTGLGLNISRTIVEAHGGRIGAISKPGEGSTFWLRVPARGPDAAKATSSTDALAGL